MPPLLMFPLRLADRGRLIELVIVVQVRVMGLNPYAGDVHGVDMSGEAAVGFPYIRADVLRDGDRFRCIAGHFVAEHLAEIILKNLIEVSGIVVNGVAAFFLQLDERVDGGVHVLVIRRGESFENSVQSDGIRQPRWQWCHQFAQEAAEGLLRRYMTESQALAVNARRLRGSEENRAGEAGMNPAAESHGLDRQQQILNQQIGLDMAAEGVQPSEGHGRKLVQRLQIAVLQPLPHSRRLVEVPVIDPCRPESPRLLPTWIDDW